MRATYLDGIPILFDVTQDCRPDHEFDRALRCEFGERVTVEDYDGEYPLRAHALIVSLSKLEEAGPVIRKVTGLDG